MCPPRCNVMLRGVRLRDFDAVVDHEHKVFEQVLIEGVRVVQEVLDEAVGQRHARRRRGEPP